MKVYLIGVGLGSSDTLTAAARQAIEECPVLIGAPRLLKEYEGGGKTCLPLIAAADIEGAVHKQENGPVAVLLSGDVGFYSGAKNLYPLLEDCDLTVLPGLSSMVYFCAALRTPWQDVFPVSAHGRAHNAPGEIQCHGRTFVLTGGGSLVWGFDRLVESSTSIKTRVADDAEMCVAYGVNKSLELIGEMQEGPLNLSRRRQKKDWLI